MEILRLRFAMMAAALALSLLIPSIHGQVPQPGPAPAPSNDGVSLDQGIAYVLMMVALAITYMIH